MDSLQGHFLVATSELIDPNFARSVVLIVRHNDEGALGLIVNRTANVTIDKVWEQVSDTPCHLQQPLNLGGPCPGALMAVHTYEFLLDCEILPGLYFSQRRDNLERLVLKADDPVKFFIGYAGWAPDQLESEIEHGSWLTTPADLEHVFGDGDPLWAQLTRHVADAKLLAALKIKNAPKDPSLN